MLRLGALALVGVVVLSGCGSAGGGAESKEALVETYLEALESRDAAAIRGLMHPDRKAERAIGRMLKRYGGRHFERTPVTFLSYDDVYEETANCSKDPPGTGGLGAAVVRSRGFVQRLYLVAENDRCYLLLEPDAKAPLEDGMPSTTVEGWQAPATG